MNCLEYEINMPLSSTLSIKELHKLKGMIIGKKLQKIPVKSEYELLRIKDGNISIIAYKSGKIVYEDNPETMAIIDHVFINHTQYDYELGTDEVGKGEWYGPMVIVCTAIKPEEISVLRKLGVRDSKTLSDNEIHRLAEEMKKIGIKWRLVELSPSTYNQKVEEFKKENKNINELLAWSHSALIKDMLKSITFQKIQVVIDKFDVEKTYKRLSGVDTNKVKIIQKAKGESEIPVAAASILAKDVFNDEVNKMIKYFGIDIKHVKPEDIPKDILKKISKHHFKNIAALLT